MRNNLLKSLLVGVALLAGTAVSFAEEFTLSPSEATVIDAGNADQNFYDASATTWNVSQSTVSNGAFKGFNLPVLLAKFDASATLSGLTVTKATLSFNAKCSAGNYNSSMNIASISTDWEASTATWNSTNTSALNATIINSGTWTTKGKTTAFSIDVTELLQNDEDKIVGFGICTNTARAHDISDLVLTIEAIDASASTTYTVKYVDGEGNELKTAGSYTESIGASIVLKDADKASIYSEDGTKKYIYVSDDSEGKTVESGAATVVTVTFREAETWSYSYNAVDADGNVLMEDIVKGTNFEQETFNVGIPAYLNIDGTLYKTGKTSSDKKGYYQSFTLSENNMVKTITYSATETTNVVYFSEAENIEGLTKATNSNTGVRSSNGASAYAASEDVVFTTLPAGKYKLTTIICDASKNAGSTWNFLAGEETIFTFTASTVNWSEGTSDEFTLTEETPIALGKGGSATQAVDLIYIVKTGDYVIPIDSIANIGALKDLADSTDVILTLKDAKVNMLGIGMMGYEAYVEDATDAIKFDANLTMALSEVGLYQAGIALNGTLCAKYTVVDGTPTLAIADSTGTMTTLTAEETTVVPTEMTVAEAKKAESLSHYILIKGAEMTGDVDDMMYAIQEGDTIQVYDQFWSLGENFEVPAKADSIVGVVVLHNGVYTIYPEKIVADASADTFAVVNSIAEMKALGDNAKVELKLNGAKVISVYNINWTFNDIYLEDGTGAVMIDPESQFDEPFANMVNKSSVTGSLFVKYIGSSEDAYFMDMPTIYPTTKTAESELTIEEGATVEPIAMTIEEASAVENAARYVKFTDLTTVDGGSGTCTASQGDASIDVIDCYFQIVNEETVESYVFPENVSSLTGIIFYDGGTFSLFPFDADGNSPIVAKTTGINTVKAAFDAKAGKVYNLNGQRVMNPTKGLFIQNGKKVIVK